MWQVSAELPKLVNQDANTQTSTILHLLRDAQKWSLSRFVRKNIGTTPAQEWHEHVHGTFISREIRRLRGLSLDRSQGRDVSDHHASPFVGTPRRSNRSDMSLGKFRNFQNTVDQCWIINDYHYQRGRSSPWHTSSLNEVIITWVHDIQWPTGGFFRGGPTPNATFPQGSIRTSFLRNYSVDDPKKDLCYVRPDFCGGWGWVALGRYPYCNYHCPLDLLRALYLKSERIPEPAWVDPFIAASWRLGQVEHTPHDPPTNSLWMNSFHLGVWAMSGIWSKGHFPPKKWRQFSKCP